MVITAWGKTENGKTYLENCPNTDSDFAAMWSTPELPKGSENGHFSRRFVFFTLSVGFVDVIGRRSLPKRPERHFFFWARGPIPKL